MRPRTTLLLAAILLFDFELPAAATAGPALRGQVVAAGEPVARVQVTLTALAGHWQLGAQFLGLEPFAAAVAEAETDGDGRFAVVAPAAGFWRLKLVADGFAPRERLLLDLVDDRELGQIELQPAKVLEVVVTDLEQQPLEARLSVFRTANALRDADLMSLGHRWRVASSSEDGTPWRMLPTDSAGRRAVGVAGDDRLLVRAVARGLVAAEAMTRGGGKVHLRLRRGIERRLRAVGTDGRPLSGVLVFDERAEVPLTVTDDDGRAVLTWEGTAPLRIALLDAEGRRATASIEAPRPEAAPQGDEVVTVVLAEPRTVTGRLIDRITREPIAEALVWSGDLGNHTRSGPAGDYQLLRLGQRVAIHALATGYLRRRATTEGDGPAPTLPLHPTVTVSGRVVDPDGAPLAAVEIEARRDPGRPEVSASFSGWGGSSVLGRSAADGSFRIAGLPAQMALLLSARREGWAETEVEIDPLERFAHREGLQLVLEPGRRALGTVVDERREPVGGATVTLSPRGKAESRAPDPRRGDRRRQPQGSTDGHGRFAVADLAAGGYDLSIVASNHAPARILGVAVLEAAKETDLGVFVLEPGAVVEGRIVDRDARPVAGAEVRISNDPALPLSRARQALALEPAAAISDAEGRFTIAGQRPGAPLILVIDSEAHLPEVVGGLTAPTSAPVEIVLRPPSRVAGRVLDPERQGVPEAQLLLIPEGRAGSGGGFGGAPLSAESRDDGSFEIHRVPAGRITLFCAAPDLQDSRMSGLEVPEGGELAGVEVVMRAGSTVAGVVLDPEGEPVVNALVQLLNYRGGRKRSLTDGDGRYRIAGLVATTISLAADHHDFPRVARDLDLEPGSNVADLVFDGDRPVARGTWEASEKGRVRITGVPPGSYQMLIAAPGSATLSWPVSSPGDLGRIVLVRGGTVDAIVPDLAADGTVATLRLVGADGRPYRSVIRARVEDEFRLQGGRARIPGLPAGIWSVLVEAADGRSWTAAATIAVDQITVVTLE